MCFTCFGFIASVQTRIRFPRCPPRTCRITTRYTFLIDRDSLKYLRTYKRTLIMALCGVVLMVFLRL